MQLQFSRRADHDLDRLFHFLIENKASVRTADRAILAIKNGAKSLLENPEFGIALHDGSQRRELAIAFGKGAYILRYIPVLQTQTIYVLRIWHSREDRDA